MTTRFATRDRAVDLSRPADVREDRRVLARYLEPTRLMPTDGIVQRTAREITKGQKSDLDKARALYEWIVDNTFRDPKVRGCGIGDIRAMLESGNLSGKCADTFSQVLNRGFPGGQVSVKDAAAQMDAACKSAS